MSRREWQIALEPFHGFVQLAVDLVGHRALRLQQAVKNVDQFRELVFHDGLGLGVGPTAKPTMLCCSKTAIAAECAWAFHAHPALRRKWSACTPDLNRCVDRSSRCRALDRP